MVKEIFAMQTELTASEDGKHTYEVRRTWSKEGGKGLVLELYPTLSAGRSGELDLSTMHLLNHVKDFGWGTVRVVNLYSRVCSGKLKASQLDYDAENIAYLEEIFESKDIKDYDIVVATGSSFSNHAKTTETKIDIFQMMVDRGLEKQVKCIVTETMGEKGNAVHLLEKQVKCIVTETMGEKGNAVHPLFLGLHYGREVWKLEPYQLKEELKRLKDSAYKEDVGSKEETAISGLKKADTSGQKKAGTDVPATEKEKNTAKKGGRKQDVLPDKKQA